MLLDEFLEDFAEQIEDAEEKSVKADLGKCIKRLRTSHAIEMNDHLKGVALQKCDVRLLDWYASEKYLEGKADPNLLGADLVERIASLKLPGGSLWVEQGDTVPDRDHEESALLFENAEGGVRISKFSYESGHYNAPRSSVLFRTDGTIKAAMTASGVDDVKVLFDFEGPQGVIDETRYYLHEAVKALHEDKALLGLAWLASEGDPEVLGRTALPLKSAPPPAVPHQVLGRLHPQRIFEEFPGLIDAKVGDVGKLGSAGRRDMIHSLMAMMGSGMNSLLQNYAVWCADLDVEQRPEAPAVFLRGMQELVSTISGFERAGSHVFHLNGKLSEVLGQTELGGIACNDIRMPYERLYISYEERIPFPVNGEEMIFEGAYVAKMGSHELDITLVVTPDNPSDHPILNFRTPINIRLDIGANLSLEDALLSAISGDGYKTDRGSPIVISDKVREEALKMGFQVAPASRPSTAEIASFHENAFGAAADALRVVGNSLLMMGSRPEQVLQEEIWPGASKETLYQLQAPSPKGKERGRRMAELEGVMGYRLLSLDPKVEARIREEDPDRRGSPSVAYWRRGFWRQQAHGPGRSLRKLTWVEPTLCNEKAGLIAQGSLYEVGKAQDDGPDGP